MEYLQILSLLVICVAVIIVIIKTIIECIEDFNDDPLVNTAIIGMFAGGFLFLLSFFFKK